MNKPLRIRITGDASKPRSISVFEADTGAKLTNILAVDLHLSAEDSRVTLTIWGAEIDVVADAEFAAQEATG